MTESGLTSCDLLVHIWNRFLCHVLGIETRSCRGRKLCLVKHGHAARKVEQ